MSAARKSARRGRFIVLEGLDGAGTTTQAERLASALRAEGHAVLTTREPSDGPVGTLIRQALTGRLGLPNGAGPLAPETLALLFAADRTDHLAARVLPALEEGKLVLCDRYVLSSLAYQGASLPMAWVEAVNGYAVSPDLTLFVGVAPEVAAKRRAARGGAAELFEADEAQRRIAKQYLAAIRRRAKKERIVHIDGEQGIEAVTAASLAEIRKLLGRKR
ncbi:dTMP kinase [Myxococcus sp. CA051A]|uniref:Thymidylate kinase n=1 Tax=Myxococcus llanfairpwllgwyngyllgogerychwyrndrobwllllantysiliogogogochensis TaxID=2590453 RepID=A0A540X713_9BACT|nr:dTMP kinase [Myxococcus llanfairpwllgwyngyllgogerychwyrndrobwllllantysiliogogogochensis]NTX08239.1 dTMP kinase [Myxococcus sp. CA040A]NTX13630.1 dTMP kinase [Myxococcus sp. CA056]NTX38930.1 dTMP kinase [Myxococcus sp. CA033]NTX50492.1 dTMP kinase [Myxococcus sp. CA039A]NTX67667.1 dTMP kinase [Myxococcus sp. CA051A]